MTSSEFGYGLIAVLVVSLLGATSCARHSWTKPSLEGKPFLSVTKRLNFAGYDIIFYQNGLLAYEHAGGVQTSYLMDDEHSELRQFLESHEFKVLLDVLRDRGYQPGCCDMPEVGISYAGETFGYPVGGPDCEQRDLEEPVRRFIDLVNEIAGHHFKDLRRDPIPKRVCQR